MQRYLETLLECGSKRALCLSAEKRTCGNSTEARACPSDGRMHLQRKSLQRPATHGISLVVIYLSPPYYRALAEEKGRRNTLFREEMTARVL